MAEIIKATASPADIIKDLEETYKNATSRGGKWQLHADARIAPVLSVILDLKVQQKPADATLATAEAELLTATLQANKLLGKVRDDTWNAVGRTAGDPHFGLLFPGGIAAYVDGEVTQQPERMMLLVGLLRSDVHPKLPADVAKAAADAVEAEAKNLRAHLDATLGARRNVNQIEKMRRSVARAGQMALSGLKSVYKGEKFTEAEIHTIIPAHHYRAQAAANKRKKAEAKAKAEAKQESADKKPEPPEEKAVAPKT